MIINEVFKFIAEAKRPSHTDVLNEYPDIKEWKILQALTELINAKRIEIVHDEEPVTTLTFTNAQGESEYYYCKQPKINKKVNPHEYIFVEEEVFYRITNEESL